MLGKYTDNIRLKTPLIHNITNYVTVNDVANILLACGGSPIMADDQDEVEEITSICGGLCINIGTLNHNTIPSMFKAGKKANSLNHPALLDPVGAGASALRTQTALDLIKDVHFSVIRGNISEIKVLANGTGGAKGVDADVADTVTDENIEQVVAFAKAFAEKTNSVIAISGAIDIVCDSKRAFVIKNGHPVMSKITGSGCMLSAMTTAYITANPDNILEAAAASFVAMGVCGELAQEKLAKNNAGNSTFRNYLIDAVFNLDGETLERRAKYEIY